MADKKYREWWLPLEYQEDSPETREEMKGTITYTKVIEKQAVDDLQAENERLRGIANARHPILHEENQKLRKSREALRDALKPLAGNHYDDCDIEDCDCGSNNAKEALAADDKLMNSPE